MNTAVLSDENGDDSGSDRGDPDAWHADESSGVHARRLEPGEVVADRYVIRGVIGQGGFAVVYEAEHLGLGRNVAVKIMHLTSETPSAMLERFRREARISALVRHANVLEVYDTGTLPDGSPYLVMERIHGETLSSRLARQTLTIAGVVEIGRQLLTALCALTEHGIVHRDIKPENIMLHHEADGAVVVKLVDFGISKRLLPDVGLRLTSSGALVGTPHYMSPEQLRSEDVDVRTDVYSTGVVLYEALTGRVPHEGPSFSELVLAALHNKVKPVRQLRSGCPFELERIVLKALSRNRDERYPAPAAMLADLEAFAARHGLPRGGQAFSWSERPEWPARLYRRRPRGWTALFKKARERLAPSRATQVAVLTTLVLVQGGALYVSKRGFAPVQAHTSGVHPQAVASAEPLERAHLALPTPVARAQPIVTQLPTPDTDQPSHASAATSASAAIASAPAPVAVASLDVLPAFDLDTDDAPTIHASIAPPEPSRVTRRVHLPPKPEPEPEPATIAPSIAPPPTPLRTPAAERASDTATVHSSFAPASTGGESLLEEALAAYVLGKLSRAQHLYRRAVRVTPKDPSAWRGLGLVAARRQEYAEARDALERYLALAPHAPDAQAIRARINALPY